MTVTKIATTAVFKCTVSAVVHLVETKIAMAVFNFVLQKGIVIATYHLLFAMHYLPIAVTVNSTPAQYLVIAVMTVTLNAMPVRYLLIVISVEVNANASILVLRVTNN